ncbi:unnamed protein product [Thelazia callipaeda]|uniref:Phorbol-ester/DAG-type domain-containing protein n=1 Tax=Thelazia callipaeda TaxID=103827 RepID=A0A0N5CTE5_THECL|nr:unnamed protein product [Thelazia callipaeda]
MDKFVFISKRCNRCSTFLLHDCSSSSYFANPYNTLRTVSATAQTDVVKENSRAGSLTRLQKLSNDSVQHTRRTKSVVAPLTKD